MMKGTDPMSALKYTIVEHDGGWAYTADGTYSETFASHDAAAAAAREAASEQQVSDETRDIIYQDRDGEVHEETADGHDRPKTNVNG